MPAGYMAMEVAENKNEVEAATAKPDLLFWFSQSHWFRCGSQQFGSMWATILTFVSCFHKNATFRSFL
jgi:hypothetical protein